MGAQSLDIADSINVLNNNLLDIARVAEWANQMGYDSSKKFSRQFLRHYEVRPCKMLISVRLKSIYKKLRNTDHSHFRVARMHSLLDEKALNKFVNYHLGCCPRQLKQMSKKIFNSRMEKFGSFLG